MRSRIHPNRSRVKGSVGSLGHGDPRGTVVKSIAIPRSGGHARNEDLLTERPTLAIPRSCHNAQADLVRKQQVLGSNPSVGSSPPSGSESPSQAADLVASVCHNAEDLLTGRFPGVTCRTCGAGRAWRGARIQREGHVALLSSAQQVFGRDERQLARDEPAFQTATLARRLKPV